MAAGRTFVRNKNWTNTHHVADVVARYQKTFFDKLDVGILAGASQEKDNVKWFEAKRYDLLADNLSVINGATGDSETSGAATDWVMRSYFGRINLSWADKYLFEGNIRWDGSSPKQPGSRGSKTRSSSSRPITALLAPAAPRFRCRNTTSRR